MRDLVAPEPVVPEPEPAPRSSLSEYCRDMGRRCVGSSLDAADSGKGPEVTAVAEVVPGPTIRSLKLTGTLTEEGEVLLTDGETNEFLGTFVRGEVSGVWQLKNGKQLSFDLARP